jgi:hypothetical protein
MQWAKGPMIGRVFLICFSAFLIGGVGLYRASLKEERAVRRARLTKFITYFGIVNIVLLSALAGSRILSAVMVVVVALGARELNCVLQRTGGGRFPLALGMGALYSVIAAGSVLFAWLSPPQNVVFVFLTVCAFDASARLLASYSESIAWHP